MGKVPYTQAREGPSRVERPIWSHFGVAQLSTRRTQPIGLAESQNGRLSAIRLAYIDLSQIIALGVSGTESGGGHYPIPR